MKQKQVIIVGGGPAGAFAGYRLAKEGYRVKILDKAIFPRYKPCAGGILTKVNHILPIKKEWIEAECMSVNMTYRYHSPVEVTVDKPFVMMVNREKFDHELLKMAQEAGAEVYEGVLVKSVMEDDRQVMVKTGSGKVFKGDYLIGADGAISQVARSLSLPGYSQRLGIALEGEFIVSDQDYERFRHLIQLNYGNLPSGYSWIFPKDGYLSIGIGTFQDKYPDLKRKLQEYIKSFGIHIKKTLRFRGSFIPWGGINQVFSGKRTFLVGDAAGLVDPLTGEGIYYALKSSELAVENLFKINSGKGQIKEYDKRIVQEILPELKMARRVARLAFSLSPLVHRVVRYYPDLLTYLLKICSGEKSYSFYVGMFLKKIPITLFKSTLSFRHQKGSLF
ncbi:hypothetical protein BBF96_01775 [Anoxybacter fermentans]|uniref:FAD-binding domain-containing protein n=1 Tax=Anoxybacter fermentans TaxID=1323375 RepID=A0A3Q9HNR5_9FIRM|nr:geranylgeranyl reductase family protein [Anoxybacter fermentans]AZR72236.1 hypothetical protein BBF96_01775 [Anoxybacter fermentans]